MHCLADLDPCLSQPRAFCNGEMARIAEESGLVPTSVDTSNEDGIPTYLL